MLSWKRRWVNCRPTFVIEEGWNQTIIARRLHKHRNTIRAWIRRLQQTLLAHGLGPAAYFVKASLRSGEAVSPGPSRPALERPQSAVILRWPSLDADSFISAMRRL
jgi:hypothetical protein